MKGTQTMTSDRSLLLQWIEEGFSKKAWHGPNLRGAIRRVDSAQASWRPARGRHNIVEIVVHCAYWKYAVRRRIRGDKRGSFALKGNNWFALPERISDAQWKQYVKHLDAEHEALTQAVAEAPWAELCRTRSGPGKDIAAHVYGVAMHDVYHAGQIQTIKALYRSKRVT
jgi:hypothetical protein